MLTLQLGDTSFFLLEQCFKIGGFISFLHYIHIYNLEALYSCENGESIRLGLETEIIFFTEATMTLQVAPDITEEEMRGLPTQFIKIDRLIRDLTMETSDKITLFLKV